MPSAAKIDLSSLPEDQRDLVADLLREHADLLAANTALKAEATDLKQIVKRLEHLICLDVSNQCDPLLFKQIGDECAKNKKDWLKRQKKKE